MKDARLFALLLLTGLMGLILLLDSRPSTTQSADFDRAVLRGATIRTGGALQR